MLETLHSLVNTPAFYFCTGILLIVLFFWYLAAENDKVKRNAGTLFIVGLSAFSIISLMLNGMHYGIDISGGVELTLEVQPKMGDYGDMVPPTEDDMQQACNILGERLNSTGTSEVEILHSGNKILIQIPQQDNDPDKNKEKLDSMVKMLTKMAKLELLAVYPEQDRVLADPEVQESIAQYEQRMDHYNSLSEGEQKRTRKPALPRIPSKLGLNDYLILPGPVTNDETGEPELDKHGKQKVYYYVLQKPYVAMQKDVYITGAEVSKAQPDYVRKGYVDVVLNRTGAERMGKLTGSMQIGRDRMAVVLNSQVKCAPVVQAVLHKDFNISGLNGKGEPEDISKALANPLSSDLKVEGRKDVSAQLGQSALEQAGIGGLVGMVGVFAFCFWYYRSAGMVAMVGLAFNALVLLGLMSLFGFVLTLPGIAGIVLTMGVAVDANVLIYERMREERSQGRSFLLSLRNAYEKAFSAIWDSNITSLITAVILFWLASGSIKGFAVTTSVGIITSLIGAIVVTRVLFFWVEHLGLLPKDFKFAGAPFAGKEFDFMGIRKICMWSSLIVIGLGMVYTVFIRGEKGLGVDFTGGASATYVIPGDSQLDYNAVEDYVVGMQLSKEATAQKFTSGTDWNIKVRCANKDEAIQIDKELREKIPHMAELEAPSIDDVSSSLGSAFFRTACFALLAGMLGIALYLALRFEWSFAMGALVSTAHDVFGIIALVVVMGTELNIIHIGAFLTVAGYSINDTIVIFDRIRERLRTAEPSEKLVDIMNEAINTTLSRTLLTSLSTIAVLISLIVLGGPSMRDFSITMLLGIFIGTYSSIYIASPVVLYFSEKHNLREEIQKAADAEASV